MKKFLTFVVFILLVCAGVMYFKQNFIKKEDVTVSSCPNCNYMINDTKIEIKDSVVYIDDKEYRDIKRIVSKNGILLLEKENAIIGYDKKELFNYSNGFDKSYSGMRIEKIKIENNKIIIQTTRLIDKWTLDANKNFPICVNGALNYNGLATEHIDINEPVTLTYEMTFDNGYSSPIVTYKKSLAAYYKEVGSCEK